MLPSGQWLGAKRVAKCSSLFDPSVGFVAGLRWVGSLRVVPLGRWLIQKGHQPSNGHPSLLASWSGPQPAPRSSECDPPGCRFGRTRPVRPPWRRQCPLRARPGCGAAARGAEPRRARRRTGSNASLAAPPGWHTVRSRGHKASCARGRLRAVPGTDRPEDKPVPTTSVHRCQTRRSR